MKSLFFSYFLCRFLKLNIIVKLNNQLWKKKIFFVQKNSAQIRSMVSSIKYISKIFRKTIISKPLIRISTCAFQGVRKVSFSKNFAYILNGLPSLHPWIKLEAHDKHFLEKTSWQFIFADKILKTVCGNLRKSGLEILNFWWFYGFEKLFFFTKLLIKRQLQIKKIPNRFDGNNLTKHLVKYLQDWIEPWRVGALIYALIVHSYSTHIAQYFKK